MGTEQITAILDEVFDQAIVYHGFTDYLRDYEVVLFCTADPITGIPPAYARLRFKHCVAAEITTAVRADVWAQSLDERLIEYETGVDLDGYVRGVKWQANYPGASLVADSRAAREWSGRLGVPFHEVLFETNGHDVRLVFSELEMEEVPEPYVPHVIGGGGPDYKIPFSAPPSE